VTYPFPAFHSAIRQPVLAKLRPDFVDDLNPAGLFDDEEVACQMARLCNSSDTAWRPFRCVRVGARRVGVSAPGLGSCRSASRKDP
jgi:hypothetical protein